MIENSYAYDALGNILDSKESIENRILYTGQQYDQETGQYYLRARFYNPAVGRFMQEDTYRGDGLNLYAYCGNNPVVYYDPSGHSMKDYDTKSTVEPEKPKSVSEGGNNADFIVAPGGVVYTAEDYTKMSSGECPTTLYHYTTEEGMQGILSSESLNPSIKISSTRDARMGSGQYLTDIVPGSKTAGQTSRALFGVPWNTQKVSNYIEIDVSDLNVLKGRDGVFYIPGESGLDLTGRIMSFGKS